MHDGEIGMVVFFSIFIVWVAAHYCAQCFKTWQAIALKRDMVARGYTAQEIIDVVSGGKRSATSNLLANVPPAKPIKQPVYGQ
jgi:hypothetical protein